jgi:hypothetical protein
MIVKNYISCTCCDQRNENGEHENFIFYFGDANPEYDVEPRYEFKLDASYFICLENFYRSKQLI